ncbi:MAG: FadR family transcriptional regulator [Actinobacteria bacterium]|nr:FadR family transcriptional regulator [Actinomycetota bacterium]
MPPVPRRPTLADDAIERLREQITSGAWPVGTRIPTEPELVAQLGVARNTVREAVRALAHNGLLEIRQGSGTYVLATSELSGVMRRRFAAADPQHVNEFRATLEAMAAGLAAVRRTAADVRRLERALGARERAWSDGDASGFVQADVALHLAVVAAAHNDVLTELYADLHDVIADFIEADLDVDHDDRMTSARHVDHARLVAAIRDRDQAAASAEAAAHPFSWRPDARTVGPAR